MERTTLTIEGMSCGHCVRAVVGALEGVGGVRVDEVEIGTATVAHPGGEGALDRVRAAVEEAGYRVAGSRPAS